MGIKSSFITDYCTQQNFQITEYKLLSIGFQKLEHQGLQTQNPNISHDNYYQHFHTKKIYKLQNINCNKNQGLILRRVLQSLQLNKSQHLCNVVCSSVNSPNILSKTTQIKIFTQSSFLNLVEFTRQKKDSAPSSYTNLQISNFIHSAVGILTQIQKMKLPIENIDPFRFLMMKTQANKLKFDIDFSQMIAQHRKIGDSRYFSFDILENYREKPIIIESNQSLWKQNYQKNLVFDFGMIILHFLLMESNQDCYNYKTKSLCRSEFEKKFVKLTEILEERYQKAEQRMYLSKNITQNVSRGIYVDGFETQQKIQEQEPFQSIIYQMLMGMLCDDIEKRIDIEIFKKYNGKIMEKLKKQYLQKGTENTASSLIQKQKIKKAQIKSTSTSQIHLSEAEDQSFDILKLKKSISAQQMNSTAECLKLSKSRSMITHLKSKRASDREKLGSDDKQNITNINLSQSNLKGLKTSIRKLSGYKKVKISEHSYLEGYFENDLAHGLGKITRKNGDIVQCIFHNNEMIEEILPRQSL